MKSVKLNFLLLRGGGLRKCRKPTRQWYLCFKKSQKTRSQFFEHPGIEVPGSRRCMPVVSFQNQALIGKSLQMQGKMLFWTKNVAKQSVLSNHTL